MPIHIYPAASLTLNSSGQSANPTLRKTKAAFISVVCGLRSHESQGNGSEVHEISCCFCFEAVSHGGCETRNVTAWVKRLVSFRADLVATTATATPKAALRRKRHLWPRRRDPEEERRPPTGGSGCLGGRRAGYFFPPARVFFSPVFRPGVWRGSRFHSSARQGCFPALFIPSRFPPARGSF